MWATKRFLVLLIFFSISSCAIRSSSLRAQYDKRLERLEREKDKLKRATDPVDRTKTEIRIAEILLTFVSDAANAGDQERLEDMVTLGRLIHIGGNDRERTVAAGPVRRS